MKLFNTLLLMLWGSILLATGLQIVPLNPCDKGTFTFVIVLAGIALIFRIFKGDKKQE